MDIVKLRVRVRVKVKVKVKSQKSKLDPEVGVVMGEGQMMVRWSGEYQVNVRESQVNVR